MTVETLSCSSCGAPLDIPVGARYVTCSYCKARLEIKRTASVAYAETLEQISSSVDKINRNTEQMVGDLSYMRLRQELEHLDERWIQVEKQHTADQTVLQERILSTSQNTPALKTGIARVGLGSLFVLIGLTAISGTNTTGLLVAGFGVILVVAGIASLRTYSQERQKVLQLENERDEAEAEHQQEYSSYLFLRDELIKKIDKLSSFNSSKP